VQIICFRLCLGNRKKGLKALADTLGPVATVRFLQQFESGVGNYTKERDLWLKNKDVKSIVKEIKERRRRK
jgi:hypothetical protein